MNKDRFREVLKRQPNRKEIWQAGLNKKVCSTCEHHYLEKDVIDVRTHCRLKSYSDMENSCEDYKAINLEEE